MPINEEQLQQPFREGGARDIYLQVKSEGDFAGFAQRFVFSHDTQVARYALWALSKATREELSQLQPLLDSLTDLALHTANSSVRRMTLSVIERLEIDEEHLRTDFLDFCLEHMVALEEPSGVQAICMKLANKMCAFYPELSDELKRTLQAMDADYYKPAVRCVRDGILGLKKKKNKSPNFEI